MFGNKNFVTLAVNYIFLVNASSIFCAQQLWFDKVRIKGWMKMSEIPLFIVETWHQRTLTNDRPSRSWSGCRVYNCLIFQALELLPGRIMQRHSVENSCLSIKHQDPPITGLVSPMNLTSNLILEKSSKLNKISCSVEISFSPYVHIERGDSIKNTKNLAQIKEELPAATFLLLDRFICCS